MNNFFNLLRLIKSGGNPQSMLMNMVQKNANNNPMMNNLLNMMNSGNAQGVEQLARNLCKEKGINPDEIINQIKGQL